MQPTLVFRRPIVVREGVKIQRGLATYSALAASMNTVATASGCHGSSMFCGWWRERVGLERWRALRSGHRLVRPKESGGGWGVQVDEHTASSEKARRWRRIAARERRFSPRGSRAAGVWGRGSRSAWSSPRRRPISIVIGRWWGGDVGALAATELQWRQSLGQRPSGCSGKSCRVPVRWTWSPAAVGGPRRWSTRGGVPAARVRRGFLLVPFLAVRPG